MKLYEIERGSKILLPIKNGDEDLGEQLCTFNCLDGMYSNISTPDGETVHLYAAAELENKGDYYVLSDGKTNKEEYEQTRATHKRSGIQMER